MRCGWGIGTGQIVEKLGSDILKFGKGRPLAHNHNIKVAAIIKIAD